MPRKPRSKFADSAMNALAFKPSDATQHFLAAMNQDHCVVSSFTSNEYLNLVLPAWRSMVMDDLLQMHFKVIVDALTAPPTSAPIKVDENNKGTSDFDELSPAEKLINAIAAFRQWFKSNNFPEDHTHSNLSSNIRWLAMMFNLIPAPHQCPPPPPPCTHSHQDNVTPCQCLHANNIPPPPSCLRPHHNDEDIPMELPAPTHAFSEAALQTPAPSHEASTPPPPPTAVATSPAAAASIPPASPHGHASYAGTTAKNLNPAAPPFVHGPPHAPVQPSAQAQQPILSKCSKWPFYTTCGPFQCQFFIKVPSIPKDTSLPSMVKMANTALSHAKSTQRVDSAHFSPCGITCATASVPSTSDLNIIKATLSGRLLRVCICIPASQSFIKIMDVPFFKPGTTEPLPSTEVGTQLQCSIIPSNYIVHWCFIWNSPKAEFMTVWIDLLDSQ
ncbi:hypothetical protein P691DRAFT_759819 [Macrolepiota fuliginosa MF-IS2]|uniref:Uncharacterized protein n=1 Tax=Macrolepiota fuliginosa MF-IS2 TaxID=1400762 RepID=A0A9P5XED4_9AGAR|nr:hypothetical protein P691DRAFT_759819 [Macrolepiota fuliginosa MF-IS2]